MIDRPFQRSVPAVVAALAVGAAVTASPAAGQQPAPGVGVVSAIGVGSATPTPQDRTADASIAKAVGDAQDRALPIAVRAARDRAQELANRAGLTLGALVGISDVPASPFGPYSSYGIDGTFGPGRFCGTVNRYRTIRLANGRGVTRRKIGTRRTCRIPGRITTSVTVTFAVAPAA